MLLHNQLNAPISWEALGAVYSWEPYGALELPDELVPLIRSEGFPVDVAPVPPREKSGRAAAEAAAHATESETAKALAAAREQVNEAEERARVAKAAAEAADLRAAGLRGELDGANSQILALNEEVRTLRADAGEYEKMLSEQSTELAKLKGQPAPTKATKGK